MKTNGEGHERLADFTRHNHDSFVREWVQFARTRTPASDGMSKLALEDHVVDILKFIVSDKESSQTGSEQVAKPRGLGEGKAQFARARRKFIPRCVSPTVSISIRWYSEYRALRARQIDRRRAWWRDRCRLR